MYGKQSGKHDKVGPLCVCVCVDIQKPRCHRSSLSWSDHWLSCHNGVKPLLIQLHFVTIITFNPVETPGFLLQNTIYTENNYHTVHLTSWLVSHVTAGKHHHKRDTNSLIIVTTFDVTKHKGRIR